MKLFWHYGKTFSVLLLVGLLLLMGQGVCDLLLPSVMGAVAQNGWGTEEGSSGAPEAVSLQGMTLLQCFMTEDSHRQMSETYLTFEPGSSESQRLSERYPGAKEQAVCALREGLSEEQLTDAAERYGKAAYAFFLYLQQEREAGHIDELNQKQPLSSEQEEKDPGNFRDNLRDDLGKTSSLPQGVLGTMPEGALFKLPDPPGPESSAPEDEDSVENFAGMQDSQEQTFGIRTESRSPEDIAEKEEKANTRPIAVEDIDGMDIELLYTLLPRLARTKESVISDLISAAEQGNKGEIRRTGSAFKRLFYRELGGNVEQKSGDGQNRAFQLIGIALAGMISGVLAVLLLSRIVTLMGERFQHDLGGESETVSRIVEEIKGGLPLCLCTACTVPVWLIGGGILAAAQKVPLGWRIIVPVFAGIGLVLLVTGLLQKPFRNTAKRLLQGGGKRWKKGFPLGVTLLTWLMNLICALVLSAGENGQGAVTAFTQYAAQTVSAVLTAGLSAAILERIRQDIRRLKTRER